MSLKGERAMNRLTFGRVAICRLLHSTAASPTQADSLSWLSPFQTRGPSRRCGKHIAFDKTRVNAYFCVTTHTLGFSLALSMADKSRKSQFTPALNNA